MIASTGSVTVRRHGNGVSYNVLGCALLLLGTFLSVSPSLHMMESLAKLLL